MKTLDYFNFGNLIKSWVGLFQKALKHVIYEMVLCPTFLIQDEDADKGIQYPHTYLFYERRFWKHGKKNI